jgi:hypothetical protein
MPDFDSWFPLLSRSVVVGILGGAGLVLTHLYSRRGPLIYPVYAAILAALAFVSARFDALPYSAHFSAVLSGMFVATAILYVNLLRSSAASRRQLIASGRPFVEGGAPWWGLPVVALAIMASSAAIAWIAS